MSQILSSTTGAALNRHKSKQDYGTPWEFIRAVEEFHKEEITFDLAADQSNAKAKFYFTIQNDALKQTWHKISGLLWLNPPFADIAPWAEKCFLESEKGARVLMLVPASVGTNWYADFVHRKALVTFIRPRLTFVGAPDPYPKDLMLCYFSRGFMPGYQIWKWQ